MSKVYRYDGDQLKVMTTTMALIYLEKDADEEIVAKIRVKHLKIDSNLSNFNN